MPTWANGGVGAELGAGLGLLDCPPGGRPCRVAWVEGEHRHAGGVI